MKNLFLPLGLVLAFIFAWLAPSLGGLLKQAGLIPWMVVCIFLVNGFQTNLKDLPKERSFLHGLIVAGVISLFISPLLGLATAEILALPAGIALGIIVKATVPPTLSTCIVMTQLTRGYPLWALVITVILNIAGVFTIPFMLGFTLQTAGDISIDPIPLLQSLILLVLLPFLLGLGLKKRLSVDPQHILLQYLPSSCVIATVWMALSDSHALFQTIEVLTLVKIAAATLMIHFALMLLALIASKWLRLVPQARLAMLFTISQKTLPVAISVLAALDMPIGEAVMACVLFHFLMLFTDSLIAPKLALPKTEER